MQPHTRITFWFEPRSWALPLRVSVLGDFARIEIQVGPFGFTLD